MICAFCKEPGNQFVAIIHDTESKVICRKCIKQGRATPEKPKPHVSAAIPCN